MPVLGLPAMGNAVVEVILAEFALVVMARTLPVLLPPASADATGSPRLRWFRTFWNDTTTWNVPNFSVLTDFWRPRLARIQPGPWMMPRPALPKRPEFAAGTW